MSLVKADLHNHLSTSSRMRPGYFNRAVDMVERRLGAGGVLGMVNFNDERYEALVNQPGYERINIGNGVHIPEKDIIIVKGQELPTEEGHLLVLGIEEGKHLKPGRPLEDSLKEAEDHAGIIVADHPFFNEGIGPHLMKDLRYLEKFDAIETHNGEASLWVPGLTTRKANKKALSFFYQAQRIFPNISQISSSDGHSFYEIGRSWSEIEMPDSYNYVNKPELLRDVLRTGIRKNNSLEEESHQRTPGRIGALDHILDLIAIVGLAKFSVKVDFETREPYR